MMAGADRYTFHVENRPQIVGMDAVEHERNNARSLGGLTNEAQPGNFGKRLASMTDQQILVRGDAVQTYISYIFDCRRHTDCTRNIRRAGLELLRRFTVGGTLETDGMDHVPAALPGRHGVKQSLASVQRTDAGRAVQLVPGEGIEVTIQRLDVDCLVSHRLGTVDQHYGAGLMCQTHDLGDGINRTKRIGHVTYANEPRPFIQKFGVSLHIELAVVRN